MIGDLSAECGITGTMFRDFDFIDIYFCNMSGAVKLKKYPFAGKIPGKIQYLPVSADHLIVGGRGIVQRAFPYGMGKTNGSARSIAPHKIFRPGGGEFPVVVDSNHCAEIPFVLLIR